jgi:hypothetical protein
MNTGFQYPAEYSLPAAKKMKLENGIDLLQQHPELAYPDTDQQYSATAAAATPLVLPEGVSQEEYHRAWENYAKSLGYTYSPPQPGGTEMAASSSTMPTITPPSSSSEPTEGEEQKKKASGAPSSEWVEVLDDETGATYYYNPQTGESSWGIAPEQGETEEANECEEEEKGESS